MQFQKVLAAQAATQKARPRAFHQAQLAVRAWGRQEKLILQAVADAIAEAHELGLAGKPLPEVDTSIFGGREEEEPQEQATPHRTTRTHRTAPAPAAAPVRTRRTR